ncbi:MAG: SMP-30/gluconolactonase/LRE family protein [Alphaproteobacteria bacterium]
MNDLLEICDPRFKPMVDADAALERLHTGMLWAEGPVYFADSNTVLFSDIPNDCIWQWAQGLGARLFRKPANYANGNTRDRAGRLVSCEHLSRRVTRTEPDGSITVLADRFEAKRLNSPNDVVVKSDGTIWFTDPPYGILTSLEGQKSTQEQRECFVFCLDPETGDLKVAADGFDKPNGLAFSVDEKKLYVSDTGRSHDPDGPHHIYQFDVSATGNLSNRAEFAAIEPGLSDGFRLDTKGNIWTSAGDGVQVFAPDGVKLGCIKVPEVVSNLVFGGPDRRRLYITATTSLYSIQVNHTGVQTP